jgi:hypothetical protein
MKYEPVDKIASACDYFTEDEQTQLLLLVHKYQHLFNGSLGTWNSKPYDIEFKPEAKPYHSRPFLVLQKFMRSPCSRLNLMPFESRCFKESELKQMGSTQLSNTKKGCYGLICFQFS